MSTLPIVHMTLYKHGVGYYRRRGAVGGQSLALTFRREEMDDLLKSLTVIDHGGGQVRGVDYDTPQSRQERLAGNSVILDDQRSLRDLIKALRGREVQLHMSDGGRPEGTLVGLDEADDHPQKNSLVSILQADSDTVFTLPLDRIEAVTLRDETAVADLRFFLKTALGQETHRSITIRLSPGSHDLEVSYIAPAPTWRVSYRLVVEEAAQSNGVDAKETQALLQGWGIFDNRLEEDLDEISLSFTAGMPISFIYDLYTPYIPERPRAKDDERTAAAPVNFEGKSRKKLSAGGAYLHSARTQREAAPAAPGDKAASGISMDSLASAVKSTAEGQAKGELFQYNVNVPVSVGRGQSAMVPIVSSILKPRKELIYNGRKLPDHPVATFRFGNDTGLTLEQGPVTVLDGGEYAGEAVLPFTPDQSEAVVAYAVELGIRVKETHQHQTQIHSLSVEKAFLVQNVFDIRCIEYHIENRTPDPKSVLIEYNLRTNYQIFDTPDPLEKTLEACRYRVDVAAGESTTFLIQARRIQVQRQELRNLSYRGLQQHFKNNLLDQQTYQRLKGLLDVWAEMSQLEKQVNEREKRRSEIFGTQEQIRKNIGALAQSGEEGKLRGQYVQQLAQSENELAEIEHSVGRLKTQIEQKQSQAQTIIGQLNTA